MAYDDVMRAQLCLCLLGGLLCACAPSPPSVRPTPPQVEIRGASDLRLLASLHPLTSGEWIVISRSGAIDGSAAAIRGAVTRVQAGTETLVFDGRLGWDRAHVTGVLGRTLAGEDAPP